MFYFYICSFNFLNAAAKYAIPENKALFVLFVYCVFVFVIFCKMLTVFCIYRHRIEFSSSIYALIWM